MRKYWKNGILAIPVFSVFLGISAFSQIKTVIGTIRDNNSLQPVQNANIKVDGTQDGVFTDQNGRFSLLLKKIPSSITISCVGYEPLYYEIDNIPTKPLELVIRQRAFTLKEVDIKAVKVNFVYRDKHYSILDYEIIDDMLILLVFRYQLKHTELILLTMNGDTLKVRPVPELKPKCLYKDFLGNIHYISTRGNAFQCFYNEKQNEIEFPYKTTYDSLLRMVQPFLFSTGDRFYFQEFTPDGLGTNFGYYDTAQNKKYFQTHTDEKSRKNLADDVRFYSRWNEALQANHQSMTGLGIIEDERQPALSTSHLSMIPLVNSSDLEASKAFNYHRINAPLIKLIDNEMAVFNFSEGIIEIMNMEGIVNRRIPINFRTEKEENLLAGLFSIFIPTADWEWSGKILIDEYYRDVYTTFHKNGMVQIKKIDLETGNLGKTFTIPLAFPQKIEIFRGNAFFLNKEISKEFEAMKLVKLKL